jgi:uncharacterized protein (DUF2147 family)
MKKIISFSFLLLLNAVLGINLISASSQPGIEGKWKNPQKGITILIYQEEDKYFGKLIAAEDPAQNEKISNHGEIVLLRDFKKESQTQYCCGTIFQPKEKRTLSATLILEDDNSLKIKARYGLFSGTQNWIRL